MSNRWRALALLASVASGALACDTLSARRIASDAAKLYAKGEFEAAAKKYEEAIAIDPSIESLHLNLGFSYLQLLRSVPAEQQAQVGRKAISALVAYRDRNPQDPRGRDYIMQTFSDTLLYDDAVKYLEPEVSRDPPSLEAITVLGQIAAKAGKLDEAERWCRKRIEVRPQDPAGYQCLGSLLWNHLHKSPTMMGTERISVADQALEALMKAIELKPEVPDPYTFANLVHRERALGHPCGVGFDAGFDPDGMVPDAGVDEKACEAAKVQDLTEAQKYQVMAKEKLRALTSSAADGGT